MLLQSLPWALVLSGKTEARRKQGYGAPLGSQWGSSKVPHIKCPLPEQKPGLQLFQGSAESPLHSSGWLSPMSGACSQKQIGHGQGSPSGSRKQ